MWLVDLNYIFECDWLIKLSDNKLSNNKLSNNKLSGNNLASELMENKLSKNKIGRPRSGSPICLSLVLLQTELDDTKSYYQLIKKLQFPRKRKIAKLWIKGKIRIKILTKEA